MGENCYAGGHLCLVSLILTFTYKPFILSVIVLKLFILNVIMLSGIDADCHYAECRCAKEFTIKLKDLSK